MRDLGGHGPGRRPPNSHGPGNVRRGDFGTNGHTPNQAPGRRFDALSADDDEPVDLVELQADDELINALSAGMGVSGPGRGGYDADDHLVAVLAAWRADVDSEPIPELVEPDVAIQMLQPAPRSRRGTFLRPLAAAVAVAACGLAAVSIGAHDAEPGDALWGVSKVLYSDRAGQVQAASDLRAGIERVNAKLATGDTAGARQDLASMGPLLGQVESGQQRAYFDQQQQFLKAKAAETPQGVPVDPATPLRNGTEAPQPPTSEGRPDPSTGSNPGSAGTSTDPGSGSSTAGSGTEDPRATSPESPSRPTDPTRPGTSDPRVLQAPEGGTGSPESPPKPTSKPSPTTEGTADPTTRPTASGEGTPQSPATSTTPN